MKSGFIVKSDDEVNKINDYASSRGITRGYYPSIVPDYSTGERVDRLALMFVHIDEEMNECGAKFRFISPEENRFTARGSLKFYVLENLINNHSKRPCVYFVESETSANSLWEVCKQYNINCVVISMGGVGNRIQGIPYKYKDIEDRYIIIDYDGNEDLYKKRLKIHEGVAEPIKIQFPKDEDFNSMYSRGEKELIKNLIVK